MIGHHHWFGLVILGLVVGYILWNLITMFKFKGEENDKGDYI
jgi:xanthine/uracil permease